LKLASLIPLNRVAIEDPILRGLKEEPKYQRLRVHPAEVSNEDPKLRGLKDGDASLGIVVGMVRMWE
jgi:hypothetical protein